MKSKEIIRPLEGKFNSLATECGTGVNFAKESAFAIQAIGANQYLQRCSTESIQKAVLNVALIGLSLNPSMKLAYIVPRGKDACLDISYQGLVKLLTDTGSVKSIYSEVVRSSDEFKIELGTEQRIHHVPDFISPGKTVGVYSVATLSTGEKHICFMNLQELKQVRSSSQFSGKGSIWEKWEDEMFKKTVIKRHYKQLPKSERHIEIAEAIEVTNDADGFKQKDNFDDVFDVEQVHVEIPEADPAPVKKGRPKKEPAGDEQKTLL